MLSCSSDYAVNVSTHRTYMSARTNDNSGACTYVMENSLRTSPYGQRRKRQTIHKVLRVRYDRIRTFASLLAYITNNKILPNVRATFVAIRT